MMLDPKTLGLQLDRARMLSDLDDCPDNSELLRELGKNTFEIHQHKRDVIARENDLDE